MFLMGEVPLFPPSKSSVWWVSDGAYSYGDKFTSDYSGHLNYYTNTLQSPV